MIFLTWAICMYLIVKLTIDSLAKQEKNSSELDK